MINAQQVKRSEVYKYLGIFVDDKLSFSEHIDDKIKKANKRLYFARVLRKLNVKPEIIVKFIFYSIIAHGELTRFRLKLSVYR